MAAGSQQREQQQQQKQLPKQQRKREHSEHCSLVPLPENLAVETGSGSTDRKPAGLAVLGAPPPHPREHLPHHQQPQHGPADHQQTLGHRQTGRGVILPVDRKLYVRKNNCKNKKKNLFPDFFVITCNSTLPPSFPPTLQYIWACSHINPRSSENCPPVLSLVRSLSRDWSLSCKKPTEDRSQSHHITAAAAAYSLSYLTYHTR